MTTMTASAEQTAPAAARRYVVKWDEKSGLCTFPCERRDLTFEQAAKIAHGFARRLRNYLGCPIRNVRVAYDCDCGRDVTTFAEPHTVPYTGGHERCAVTAPLP